MTGTESNDYLLGLSDERYPTELSFARKYELVSEDTLLAWLGQQNAELAEIMRAIRTMPEEEQQVILQHMANEIRFIRRMVSKPGEVTDTQPAFDEQLDDDDEQLADEPEPEPTGKPKRSRQR